MNKIIDNIMNKVPEITIAFWIMKICATTVWETGADFLNFNLNVWLTHTTIIMSILLIISLIFQFKSNKYVWYIYWTVILFISVVGTLITDNLTDNMWVNLITSTAIFSGILAIAFALRYSQEWTLSMNSINTNKRESFYRVVILFTFALWTAAGDLLAEKLWLGYGISALLFGAVIWIISLAYYYKKLSAVLAFWMIYILTRPLGASIWDLLSQSKIDWWLGLWTTNTSIIFIIIIIWLLIYTSILPKLSNSTKIQ